MVSSLSSSNLPPPALIALETRGSFEENYHWGWCVVTDASDCIIHASPGADKFTTFFRSSAKPFQTVPLVKVGLYHKLTSEELAITIASHAGTPRHIGLVQSILQKAGLAQAALQCGQDFPMDVETRENLKRENSPPQPIYHNCSGKHAGMLYFCVCNHLPTENYLDPNHPLQEAILNQITALGGIQPEIATDGCGAPVFHLPLRTMALLYAKLASDPSLQPIKQAMQNHPEIIGGIGRTDSSIIQVTKGRLIAKAGADGIILVANESEQLGLGLKIADGSQMIRDSAIIEILHQIGWLQEAEYQHPYIQKNRHFLRLNSQQRPIGEIQIKIDF